MEPVAIVTMLALIQYFWFGYRVGEARMRHDVQAPATVGAPEFERNFRVHQNTLEQLAVFLPALWMFGWYVHAVSGALIGLLYIAGRVVYRKSYMKDPASRTLGVAIGGAATMILLIGGGIGALVSWIS